MKRAHAVLVVVVSTATLASAATAVAGREAIHADTAERSAIVQAADQSTARKVILMIGDGMGVQEVTAARYYQGVQNAMNVDRLPYTGFDTTYSVKKGSGPTYLPDYTPDSAATATQIATGRKTIDERVSQGPSASSGTPGQRYATLVDAAQAQGKRVGLVTTTPLTDATPAAMIASMSRRRCEGPANMADCPTETKAAGGLGSIAEQAVDQRAHVLLGGGRSVFQQTIAGGPTAGRTVLQTAQEAGYRYVTTASGLSSLSGAAPVLGLFSSGNLPLEWTGPAATRGKGNSPVACTEGQRSSSVPSLGQMTSKAIELLDGSAGFFLMVEGGSIDDAAHVANACGEIGEAVAFDKAVGAALDYQARNPDTLVVVTADHSHATQILNDDYSGQGLPTGYSANLRTKDGSTLTLHFGTSGFGGDGQPPLRTPPSQQHTGGAVPVWAVGPGAAGVLGTHDHTELYALLNGASGPVPAPAYAMSGDTWHYNDSGADLGTAWRAARYDDAAWRSGPTQLGYGDGDERTSLTWGSDPNAKPLTTYARRTFDAGSDISGVTGLALRTLIDDGAVVYLNGAELARFNLPTGTISSTTRASTTVFGAAESQWQTTTVPATALAAGANQLAVEIHQDAGSSSDVSFDLELAPVR